MKKPAALLVALAVGATVAACDRSITTSEGHTIGSGNMQPTTAPHADAVVDTTKRSGYTIGSGN